MTDADMVNIKNTMTGLYAPVPKYIFEHPVYGQYMIPDDREEPDCIDCGKDAEDKVVAKVTDKPAEITKAKDDK